MAKEQHGKGLSLVILGIVAILAIVGLVLLFTNANRATGGVVTPGSKVYGGAIKGDQFPYWSGRGVPMGGREEAFQNLDYAQATTNWNYYGQPKRAPGDYVPGIALDVPSVATACGPKAIEVPYGSSQRIPYYQAQGYNCVSTGGTKPGVCCFIPDGMLGGIAQGDLGANYGRTPYTYG